jgi:hypothetical protein
LHFGKSIHIRYQAFRRTSWLWWKRVERSQLLRSRLQKQKLFNAGKIAWVWLGLWTLISYSKGTFKALHECLEVIRSCFSIRGAHLVSLRDIMYIATRRVTYDCSNAALRFNGFN